MLKKRSHWEQAASEFSVSGLGFNRSRLLTKRQQRRRLVALERKQKKIDRSIKRLQKSIQ
jgi:hypothetical protein